MDSTAEAGGTHLISMKCISSSGSRRKADVKLGHVQFEQGNHHGSVKTKRWAKKKNCKWYNMRIHFDGLQTIGKYTYRALV